jgi:quinohemoprotein ethanol dehydrogenase
MSVAALDDPAIKLDEADVKAGSELFVTCSLCHGRGAASAGTAPDLRESAVMMQPDALRSVVHDGALRQNGMPPFADLSDTQLHQIAAYVRAKAREALGTRNQDGLPARGSRF